MDPRADFPKIVSVDDHPDVIYKLTRGNAIRMLGLDLDVDNASGRPS